MVAIHVLVASVVASMAGADALLTRLNPVPNAQVCVYLTVHITKLQL